MTIFFGMPKNMVSATDEWRDKGLRKITKTILQ